MMKQAEDFAPGAAGGFLLTVNHQLPIKDCHYLSHYSKRGEFQKGLTCTFQHNREFLSS